MEIIYILLAYLIGATPFSIIVGKIVKKVDIRNYGSGNPGTTNAFRVLGKPLGFLVFFLDVIKGGIMILLFRIDVLDPGVIPILVYGLMSAIGHIFPVFIKFKGGKAVATSVGIFLFYAPVLGVIGLLGYIITLITTRYVSISSCVGAASLWVTSIIVYFIGPPSGSYLENLFGVQGDLVMPIVATIGNVLIFYRHRGNFIKIKQGVEPKSNFMAKNKVSHELEDLTDK